MQGQIQTTCFEQSLVNNALQTAGELEINDCYTGISAIVMLLSQEPHTPSQTSSNRLSTGAGLLQSPQNGPKSK